MYFLTWIQEQEAAPVSNRHKETVQQLNLELDDLRQAWDWAIGYPVIEPLRLATWPFRYSYELRGLL